VVEFLQKNLSHAKIELNKREAGFRLDIAIKTPTGEKIVIECDGASFHSSLEAYGRDIFRQQMIEQRCGYVFHRIRSTNWWIDQKNEEKKLLEFLRRH
jgi:very-short-patch-repair endonuclease